MKVGHREKFGLTVLDPAGPGQGLTLWAVAIPAAVEGVPLVAAIIAAFKMAAQSGGPAQFDGRHDAPLPGGQRRAMSCAVCCAVAAEHIRHFQLRTIHGPRVQKCRDGAGLGSKGTGRGSRSRGLEAEHTLLVAIRR